MQNEQHLEHFLNSLNLPEVTEEQNASLTKEITEMEINKTKS